jgi:Putative prokaryotic signal transducing protein
MDEMKYTQLVEVLGRWKAEIIESYLKAEGIDVVLIEDSISQSTYANPFAPVQVFVPKDGLQQARELMESFDDSEDSVEEDSDDEEEE